MENRQSQKQSALTRLAKIGVVTTNPTPVHKALVKLSNQTTTKKGARRRHRAKKTHKKNRKSYF